MTARRQPPKRRPTPRRVAWLVVDRTGYPDAMYGPAVNGGPRKAATGFARRLNETATDTEHKPWRAVKAYYDWPILGPQRRGKR